MFQLDLKNGVPICDQIVNGFIKLKALGVLKGGEQLPSVRVLASQFSVNPNTVQKAYAILEANGIVYSVKGKGSFISDDDRAHKAIIENAENNFKAAIMEANRIGLSKEQLIALVGQTLNEKEELK
ncbi:MAG: GntR family transcriptional regulator [Clostridia bacterium]|nr:GntR family transcriptional regulator [Clostridia bacterium]